jgi:hypothetical protein
MLEHCRTCSDLGQHREAHFIVWMNYPSVTADLELFEVGA